MQRKTKEWSLPIRIQHQKNELNRRRASVKHCSEPKVEQGVVSPRSEMSEHERSYGVVRVQSFFSFAKRGCFQAGVFPRRVLFSSGVVPKPFCFSRRGFCSSGVVAKPFRLKTCLFGQAVFFQTGSFSSRVCSKID